MYGRYGYTTRLGSPIYHSVGDREAVVREMSLAWNALYDELARAAGVVTDDPQGGHHLSSSAELEDYLHLDPRHPAWYQWWLAVAEPIFKEWVTFERQQLREGENWIFKWDAFRERWETDWPTYEHWRSRLLQLREDAQKIGIDVKAPPPGDLPTTIPEDIGHVAKQAGVKVAEKAGEAWNLVKYAIYGGIVIGGVIALSSVAQNLRANKDPAAPYLALANRRSA